ncbi:hypothetical protein B296_00048571 [Ensete ventricosum]|uniref:Retrotransposon gag domain-containing protein n=1 Tax=Ensete ventricosum TaxID=4639 RepID=A0A426YPR7_ENSVE|nr:hypothetical protein B296_00048571 [Ensete ventricosum]
MLEAYDGSSDPIEHVVAFRAPKPTAASLLRMRQKEDEHLGRYLAHFAEEIRAIPDAHPSLVIQAFMIGIRPSLLFWSLVERPPMTMPEMLQRANQYIWENGLLKILNPMKSRPKDWDHGCFCRFHRDYGHNTEECYDLKNQIEDLIRRNHLDRYTRKPRELSLHPKGPVERQVDVIVGGPAAGGDSPSARNAYAHAKVQKRPEPGALGSPSSLRTNIRIMTTPW